MPAGMSVNTWRSNGWRSPRLVPVRLTLSSRCMLRSSSNLKVVCQTGGEMNVRVVKAFIVGLALIIAMPSLASAQSTSQKLFDQFRRETGQYHPTDPRHPTNRARVNRNRQQQLQQQKQRTRQRYRPPQQKPATRQRATGQKKPAGFDPKAAANSWKKRQGSKYGSTHSGRPSGITTNRSRASGAGTTRRGKGIEGEGIDGIKMRGLTPKKQARKKQKYCRCKSDDWSQYGVNCLPIKRAVREKISTTPYPLGVYRWTSGCTSTAWK
jgi:hypothetical protein